jgi:hypothetical protein
VSDLPYRISFRYLDSFIVEMRNEHVCNNLRVYRCACTHSGFEKCASQARVNALMQKTGFSRSSEVYVLFSMTVRDRVFETGKVLSH